MGKAGLKNTCPKASFPLHFYGKENMSCSVLSTFLTIWLVTTKSWVSAAKDKSISDFKVKQIFIKRYYLFCNLPFFRAFYLMLHQKTLKYLRCFMKTCILKYTGSYDTSDITNSFILFQANSRKSFAVQYQYQTGIK